MAKALSVNTPPRVALINPLLITGLNAPTSMTISGGNLYVVNELGFEVSEYALSGALVNAAVVSGLPFDESFDPTDIAVVNGDVFVATSNGIYEYTTSGAVVAAPLIPAGSFGTNTSFTIVPEPPSVVLLTLGGAAVSFGALRRSGSPRRKVKTAADGSVGERP